METKDNAVTTYRSHRVGSVTAGISMIGYGVMFLLHLFFDMVEYQMMFSLWPVMLIGLGLELFCSGYSVKRMVYDKAAILSTYFLFSISILDPK